MNAGRIEQIGTPDEVYTHPANAFVYGFLGTANRFDGRARGRRVPGAGLQHRMFRSGASAGDGPAIAFARPHELEVERVCDRPPMDSARV